MKKGNLLLWETPSSAPHPVALAIGSLSLRVLPASSLDGCFKWLEGPVPIDGLILILGDKGVLREKEFLKLKQHPQMMDVPTLVVAPKETLAEQQELLKACEDFVLESASAEEIRIRTIHLLNGSLSHRPGGSGRFLLGSVQLEPSTLRALKDEKELSMTPLEFRLLYYFFKNQGRVLSREELLRKVWGYQDVSFTRTVDTFIKRLRKKLGKEGERIETLRAVGYRLKEERA
jgi:DNA-binding response OmpR family regulator